MKLHEIKSGSFIVKSVYYNGGKIARIDGYYRHSTKLTSKWFTVTGIKRVMSQNFIDRWL